MKGEGGMIEWSVVVCMEKKESERTDGSDESSACENTYTGRIPEERVQTERRDDLHPPQAKCQPDSHADRWASVAGYAAVGVVGVGTERDEGASDERGGDGEAVGDDFEEPSEPELPEKLWERSK
jgi:hypothetical protein